MLSTWLSIRVVLGAVPTNRVYISFPFDVVAGIQNLVYQVLIITLSCLSFNTYVLKGRSLRTVQCTTETTQMSSLIPKDQKI